MATAAPIEAYDANAFFHAGFDPAVSVFGSLGFVAANVVLALLIEHGLKLVEKVVEHHPTYFRLLTKMYQELMVGGFTAFVSKRIQQWNVLSPDDEQMVNSSDDMVLYYGLAIALQSMVMFWRLRKHNSQVDKLSLLTAQELYNEVTANGDSSSPALPSIYHSVIKMKIVRRYFLNAYQLPELFSFPKYLRAIQDSEIIQLFDIELFAWLLLVGIYVAFFAVCGAVDHILLAPESTLTYADAEHVLRTRLLVLFVFIACLGLVMCLLNVYLKRCVHWIVVQASNSEAEDHHLVAALGRIATEEAHLIQDETTESAIARMTTVANSLSEKPDHSTIWGLLQTLFRKVTGHQHTRDPKLQIAKLHLPFFSRKLLHVFIKLLLNMNAMYFALVLQSFFTILRPSITYPTQMWYPVILLALTLALGVNMAIFGPRIVGRMALVNATVRVNAAELKRSVEHFTEVLEVQEKMVAALVKYTATHLKSLEDMQDELKLHDDKHSGYIEIDVLRRTIKRYGFKFSKNKFNTFIRLQFKTKGTTVQYETFLKVLHRTIEKNDYGAHATYNESPTLTSKVSFAVSK